MQRIQITMGSGFIGINGEERDGEAGAFDIKGVGYTIECEAGVWTVEIEAPDGDIDVVIDGEEFMAPPLSEVLDEPEPDDGGCPECGCPVLHGEFMCDGCADAFEDERQVLNGGG